MKRTHNQAIEIAETGDWNNAWKIAQQDEGLNPDVTQEQWTTFAKKCIAQRNAEKEAQKYAPEYSF